MSDGRIGRWGAVLREALAVLAAILVAFALDAWWDGRVERRDMLEALDAVAVEVDANIAAIDTALTFNSAQTELIAEAMGLSAGDVARLDADGVARLASLPDYTLVTLRLGATAAFIEGGHLEVLEDRALRADVAGLPRLQLELDEEVAGLNDVTLQFNNALLDVIPLENVRRPSDMMTEATDRAILLAIATDRDTRRALLGRTFILTFIYGGELQNLRTELAEIRTRIAAELGS